MASEWRSVGQSQHPKTRDQSQIISSRRQERREDGLEVKVAFGDVWKQSLTELSGGQRSLVALSLSHPCIALVQSRTHLYIRPSGCRTGPKSHHKHWFHDQEAFLQISIHYRLTEGGHVQ